LGRSPEGAGRPRKAAGKDDSEERAAVFEACGAILELLADEMRMIDPASRLSFVSYHRTGFERAIGVVEKYRAEVQFDAEVPIARMRFRA
jgi:hypothetical protein